MRKLYTLFLTMLLLLSLGCSGIDQVFYQPDHRTYTTPERDGYTYEEIQFNSADGTRLSGWFIPARGITRGTVVHYHGNAQNMSAHYAFVSWLPAAGYNLFVFDYRGYGQSGGAPERKGIYQDSLAALHYVQSRPDIDPSRIIVFGQSIGGANALTMMGNNELDGIAGVVSDSAFSSYKGVAGDHAGILKPLAYLLVSNKLSPVHAVKNIAPVPLLVIHGTHDRVAPYRHAIKLYKEAAEPKQLWTIEGGRHTSALGPDRAVYAPRLVAQFNQWMKAEN